MKRFGILYDSIENNIIIPNHDINGRLIGVRARHYGEFATVKYKPIWLNGKLLSHPNTQNLYGAHITKKAIQAAKTAIIFEGEKSVLKMDSYYNENNFSVATLGQNITKYHCKILSALDVREVVIAFDADYKTVAEFETIKRKYYNIGKSLKAYFNVSLLLDDTLKLLDYKSSPIDCGKEKFENLLRNRIFI